MKKIRRFDYAPDTIVPRSFLPQIGRIAALYVNLDGELNRTIWDLMGVDSEIGTTVTQSIQNFSTRCDLFLELSELRQPPENHCRLREIRTQLRTAGDDRNLIMHAEPHMGSAATPFYAVRRGRYMDPNLKVYVFTKPTLADLEDRLVRLARIIGWFRGGHRRWLAEPLPLLDKSPIRLLEQSRRMPSNPDKPKRLPLSSRQRREQALARRTQRQSRS